MSRFSIFSLPSMEEISELPGESVLCLGNFDGVHIGHRELFRRALELQKNNFLNASSVAFFFSSLPGDFLMKDPPRHLDTEKEKLQKIADLGIDYAVCASFEAFRQFSAEEFVKGFLESECHAVAAVCGYNYHFGKGGVATASDLERLADFKVLTVEEVTDGGEAVSSTRIRSLLECDGDTETASRLLGCPYGITAPVIRGKALGRTWGFPTLNQSLPKKKLCPKKGVYLSLCEVEGRVYHGITDIGLRPTVESDHKIRLETHLLDFSGNLYGKTVRIGFLSRLRDEIKFQSEEELRAQIACDVASAKQYFQKKEE